MEYFFKNYLQVVTQRKRSHNIVNLVINLALIIFFLSFGITRGYLNNGFVLIFVMFVCSVLLMKISFALYCLIKEKSP